MELDYALLADAAQVSDGKAYILGGGVSILWRPDLPAPLHFVVVGQLAYHRSEANTEHDIRFQVNDADGNALFPEMQGQIGVGEPPNLPASVPLAAPFVIGFPPAPVLQRAGPYAVEILLDNRHIKSL